MKITHLLIPGNPAITNCYTKWVEEIKKSNDSVNILYDASPAFFNKNLNFEEYNKAMFGHYEKILLKLTLNDPIKLIAHSVGGYFALKLLEKYPEKIQDVLLIYPYIGNSTIRSLRFVGLFYTIDRLLPFTETLVKFKNLLETYYKDLKYVSKEELNTCLRFGLKQCTYFNIHIFDTTKISAYKEKIKFIYNTDDRWCPESTIELLKPISKFDIINLPHDFILKEDNRTKMTQALINYL